MSDDLERYDDEIEIREDGMYFNGHKVCNAIDRNSERYKEHKRAFAEYWADEFDKALFKHLVEAGYDVEW